MDSTKNYQNFENNNNNYNININKSENLGTFQSPTGVK
jgi:hypothetical protein